MLLKVVNVTKIYKMDGISVTALSDVGLMIEKGEFVSIVGQSGSGKSTLMHLIGCLDTPTSGTIILNGKDVSKLSEKELAKIRNREIGFVFQTYNLLARTSALENVELPLIYQRIKEKKRHEIATRALIDVGLKERINHLPSQLSGGQQQRVAIARALVTKPSLILADEPTGNLDSKTGRDLINLFYQLNKIGNTIVLVTHDLEIAKKAGRTIKISDGRIVK